MNVLEQVIYNSTSIWLLNKCLEEALEGLTASVDSEVRKPKKRQHKANKSTTISTMNFWALRKRQQLKKSEKHSGEKLSKNIQIKVEIHKNLRNWVGLIRYCQIHKKDSFMMIMERKEYVMVDLLEGQALVAYLTYLVVEAEENLQDQEKVNQNWSKCQWL